MMYEFHVKKIDMSSSYVGSYTSIHDEMTILQYLNKKCLEIFCKSFENRRYENLCTYAIKMHKHNPL